MKIKIAVNGHGGELDAFEFELEDHHHEWTITKKLVDWLKREDHILGAGDTITITEVEAS